MPGSYSSKMSSKGQLVIPAEVRKRLGLRPGTQVTIIEDKGRLVIEERRRVFERIRKLRGILKGHEEGIRKLIEEDKQIERAHEKKLERLASGKE